MVKNIQHYLDGCVAWILSFQVDEHGAGVIHSFHGLAYVGIENSRVKTLGLSDYIFLPLPSISASAEQTMFI